MTPAGGALLDIVLSPQEFPDTDAEGAEGIGFTVTDTLLDELQQPAVLLARI